MANEYKPEVSTNHGVESQDRGLFGFGKKKETEEEVIAAELEAEKVQVEESEEEEEKTPTLLERMKESDRRYSSPSEEGEGEDGEKKTSEPLHPEEKMKDKLPGQTKKPEEEQVIVVPPPVEDKKKLLEKIKDKIPGLHSKTEEHNEKQMD